MEYDGDWLISLPEGVEPPDDQSGPVLANGTVALVPSLGALHGLDTFRSAVTPPGAPGDLLDAFHYCRLRLYSAAPGDTEHALTTSDSVRDLACCLDLGNGTLNAPYIVTRTSDGAVLCSVVHQLRVLRHLPHFALHTVTLTVPAAHQAGFQVFHEIRCGSQKLTDARFNGSTVYSDILDHQGGGTYVMTARARHESLGGGGGTRSVHLASSYILEDPGLIEVTGFNVLRNDVSTGLTRLRLAPALPGGDVDGQGAYTYVFHILTGVSSTTSSAGEDGGGDAAAERQLQRAILTQLNRAATGQEVAASIIERSDRAWAERWITDLVIEPKKDATPAELAEVRRVRGAVKYAMYNLHAAARTGSIVDFNGTLRQGCGDPFIVPALTLVHPEAAATALDARHDRIAEARQHAAAFGLQGLKFPYENDDVTGFDTALYWDAETPLRVFNTALVAVNAWNYYRVSRDRDWLQDRGYALLRGCADMITSAAEPDAANPAVYHLRKIVGFDDVIPPATDNSLTVACAQLALRAAVEASYELGYFPKSSWIAVRYGLQLPFFEGQTVLRRDADSAADAQVAVLEPLLVLTPWLNDMAFGPDAGVPYGAAVQSNVPFWLQRLLRPDLPINGLLRVQALAQLCQIQNERADEVSDMILDFLDRHSDSASGWGNLRNYGSSALRLNDLNLSAMLVFALLQGLGGVTVQGGVTETRFYYAEMGLYAGTSAVMPTLWDRIRLQGIGTSQLDFVVLNNLIYPAPPLDASLTVPWSTDNLVV